jgi:lipid A 3-O-deacylase
MKKGLGASYHINYCGKESVQQKLFKITSRLWQMISTKYVYLLMGVFVQNTVFSQKNNEVQFLKVAIDNDFVNFRGEGTDRGYTSGIKLEIYYTKKAEPKFPSNLLMPMKGDADNLYGWGISHSLYTPVDIGTKSIQYGDRPYASTLMLSNILVSSDEINKQKITTSIGIGAIGEYAFGSEIQTWVHKSLNVLQPKGWDNQIKSDFLINYFVNYEKLILSPSKSLEIIGNISGNLGTLSNNTGLGIQLRLGILNDYFSNNERLYTKNAIKMDKNIIPTRAFFYIKTQSVAVMDNSLLQGGFFSHQSSPYTISKDSVNRIYMQYEYGIVVSKKRFGVTVSTIMRTTEFKNSYSQQLGNVTLHIGI